MGGAKPTKRGATWQDAGAEGRQGDALRLVAAAAIVLFTVSMSAAHAAGHRNGRLLLLTCDAVPPAGKGSSHLRTMRPDGTGFRTILRFDAEGSYDNCSIDQATWSPNGKKVLYSTFRGIWTISGSDGKRKRSVLDVGSYATWAPNGREIAFVQRVEESQADALFRVRLDGSGLRRITPPVQSEIYAPSWSPDGRTIAFTVWNNSQESIWVVGPNGSRLHKIADDGRMPGWSPDSRRIIYTDRLSILTMAPDGSHRRHVTPPVLEDETFQATYSPDGTKIAYVRDWRAYVMTARGKRAHRVSPVDTIVARVDWQRR
jgi:Tol biopolymer transport system component